MKAVFVLLALVAVACANSFVGIAHLRGVVDPNVDGTVYFVQLNASYHWVWVNVSGIATNPGTNHGIHVHQFGDVTDFTAGNSLGGHYNPNSGFHSCEPNATRHEGDMGNWMATGGAISMAKTLDLLQTTGTMSIIGKGVVLHSTVDDCVTSPTGASGTRLATGTIGVANPAYYPQEVLNALNGQTGVNTNGAVSGDTTVTRAIASLFPTVTSSTLKTVAGFVEFSQDGNGAVTITARITGLPTGATGYGIHIHTFGDYYTNGTASGTAAGAHLDFSTPANNHSSPLSSARHTGDLGNICTWGSDGTAYYQWTMNDTKFSLNGANSIIGRQVIIHDIRDPLSGTVYGNRTSQGVIGVMNTTAPAFVTIPTGVTPGSPECLITATTTTTAAGTSGTSAGTTGTTAAGTSASPTSGGSSTGAPSSTTSSSSFVAVCYTALFVLLAVVLF